MFIRLLMGQCAQSLRHALLSRLCVQFLLCVRRLCALLPDARVPSVCAFSFACLRLLACLLVLFEI